MTARCGRCWGMMTWDGDLGANKCVACGRASYPLIPGASVPRQKPPTGHQGIDFNRGKPIGTRATPGGKMVSRD